MPRKGPRRKAIAARLFDEQIEALDQIADRKGVDRSELIRRGVDIIIRLETQK